MEYRNFYISFLKGIYPAKLSRYETNRFFLSSCENGHLQMSQWLWSISNGMIDIHAENESAFRWGCVNGHLQVVQWLWSISNETINIHTYYDDAFDWSCRNGHLEVAQWLWSIRNRMMDDSYKICKKPRYYKNKKKLTTIYYIRHYYYKPYTGPGYLRAMQEV
jgi:hypothetical protein